MRSQENTEARPNSLSSDGVDLSGRASPAVALRDVSKSYVRGLSSVQVLNSINMCVERGECVFLLGPSGSGKTTLLSLIGCVLTPDRGEVRVLGHNVTRDGGVKKSVALRRNHIGFVFQQFHLIRGLSAIENVRVPLTLSGWHAADADRRARDLLEMVELAEQATADPRRLSVGQCQRVAIARALAADPALILADEPTASLDAAMGQQAMRLLRKLTVDAGKTVIVVTHDSRILPFADRIFELENGRVWEQRRNDTQAPTSPGLDHLPSIVEESSNVAH